MHFTFFPQLLPSVMSVWETDGFQPQLPAGFLLGAYVFTGGKNNRVHPIHTRPRKFD